jgi:hypothetical protein
MPLSNNAAADSQDVPKGVPLQNQCIRDDSVRLQDYRINSTTKNQVGVRCTVFNLQKKKKNLFIILFL